MGGKKKSKKALAPGDAVAAYQAYVGTFLGDAPGDTESRIIAARLVEAAVSLAPSGGAYCLAVCCCAQSLYSKLQWNHLWIRRRMAGRARIVV